LMPLPGGNSGAPTGGGVVVAIGPVAMGPVAMGPEPNGPTGAGVVETAEPVNGSLERRQPCNSPGGSMIGPPGMGCASGAEARIAGADGWNEVGWMPASVRAERAIGTGRSRKAAGPAGRGASVVAGWLAVGPADAMGRHTVGSACAVVASHPSDK